MSPKLPRVTGQQTVRALERAGLTAPAWESHSIKARTDGRRVTVPVHAGREVPLGTLRAILRDADITPDQFIELL